MCSIIRSQSLIHQDFAEKPALTQSSRLPRTLTAEEEEPVWVPAALRVSVLPRPTAVPLAIWGCLATMLLPVTPGQVAARHPEVVQIPIRRVRTRRRKGRRIPMTLLIT